ncbi:uncharacterized protein YerC [Nakamurella sp. UYEF19]|uniref:hypothetical protein n=1 Tax=Nakamurella sp. UYEF19 TaxID=1756392 RepID=UPI003392F6D9
MSRYRQLTTHPELVEVYRVLGSVAKPKWAEFYKVYELLRQAAGGSDRDLSQRTGVSQAQIGRFTASANHQEISGDDARHATMRGTPGANTGLTVEEGSAVIDQLIQGLAR